MNVPLVQRAREHERDALGSIRDAGMEGRSQSKSPPRQTANVIPWHRRHQVDLGVIEAVPISEPPQTRGEARDVPAKEYVGEHPPRGGIRLPTEEVGQDDAEVRRHAVVDVDVVAAIRGLEPLHPRPLRRGLRRQVGRGHYDHQRPRAFEQQEKLGVMHTPLDGLRVLVLCKVHRGSVLFVLLSQRPPLGFAVFVIRVFRGSYFVGFHRRLPRGVGCLAIRPSLLALRSGRRAPTGEDLREIHLAAEDGHRLHPSPAGLGPILAAQWRPLIIGLLVFCTGLAVHSDGLRCIQAFFAVLRRIVAAVVRRTTLTRKGGRGCVTCCRFWRRGRILPRREFARSSSVRSFWRAGPRG
mmetsp:Transcript_1606/g.3505  ORF Transcript_1606/g.3505 Transcript_1606/m.3505 type:complete len:353 (+) Transcript_1606:727-1785(+)